MHSLTDICKRCGVTTTTFPNPDGTIRFSRNYRPVEFKLRLTPETHRFYFMERLVDYESHDVMAGLLYRIVTCDPLSADQVVIIVSLFDSQDFSDFLLGPRRPEGLAYFTTFTKSINICPEHKNILDDVW